MRFYLVLPLFLALFFLLLLFSPVNELLKYEESKKNASFSNKQPSTYFVSIFFLLYLCFFLVFRRGRERKGGKERRGVLSTFKWFPTTAFRSKNHQKAELGNSAF